MMKRTFAVMALLAPVCCVGQTRLSTPASAGSQCVGMNCPSGAGQSNQQTMPQQATPQRPNLTPPGQPGSFPQRQQPEQQIQGEAQPGAETTGSPSMMPRYRRTEFEKFVRASLGQDLRLFGHRFFENVPTTFAPVDHVPVRADYVIGPGDELLIRAWGKIDLDARVVVDRTGQIYLPQVGAISVAGLRYQQLSGYLHSQVGKYFRDFDLSVTMGQLRSIQVYVLGYARQPGTYTVSSLSTLMNAVFASGGPAANGSMRHIQLKRNNEVVTDLDFYDVILKGDKSADAPLQSGDVIYIPHVGPLVAISGSVNQPAIYELRKSTTLGDALNIAGGLTTVAETKRVALERISQHAERRFEEFSLDADGMKRQLKDGDIVRIFPISPKIEDAVTLRGNVAQPGPYAWRQGMRISDLIPTRDALITRDYWNRQNTLVPLANANPFTTREEQQQLDQKRLQREQRMRGNGQDTAGGEGMSGRGEGNGSGGMNGGGGTFNNPDNQSEQTQESAAEDVQSQEELQVGIKHRESEINWQYAVIERLNRKDLTTELIPFDLGKAIEDPNSPENHTLEAGDVVTIFSQEDVPVATENRTTFVEIEGEVKAPGVYRMAPGETLRDAVRKAGGLGQHAYLYASELTRESTKKKREERLAQMLDRMQRSLVAFAGTAANTPEETQQQQEQVKQQQALLARLQQVKPTGRIVLGLKPTDDTLKDVPAMALEDGDKFFIPARDDTVQVLGAVYNENSFRFKPDRHVADYLNNAGGATRDGDKGKTFVIRADGSVVSRQQAGFWGGERFASMQLMPGDAIVVPEHFQTTTVLRELRDWSQVFAQFALGAAAIKVLNQ